MATVFTVTIGYILTKLNIFPDLSFMLSCALLNIVMITEEDKYIANSFKIGGFAFMTMLARFILNIREELKDFIFCDFAYLILAFIFFYFGMILLFKGSERLKERGKKKWNH